ncbi:MAG: hypothetical protein JXA96_03815 [Sedimentisphaerales bacterium]|nr:hypothetical protein [Sedimentisphaerales bacterium]
MRIITTACFLVIFACIGCGNQTYWYNKDNTYYSARSDCWECLSQVKNEIADTEIQEEKESGDSAKVSKTNWQKLIEKCMKDKGYKETWDYKLDYNIRKGFVSYNNNMYPVAGK